LLFQEAQCWQAGLKVKKSAPRICGDLPSNIKRESFLRRTL
jgi:hypothetical protein